MKDKKIENLCQRYELMITSGTKCYFEPDEVEVLASYYEENFDYETAYDVVNYGLKLYPQNEPLMLYKAELLMNEFDIDAVEHILQCITDHNMEYYFLRTEVELVKKNEKAALCALKQIISDKNCTLEDCIDIIDICATIGYYDVLPSFTKMVEQKFDDSIPYLMELALFYEECGENDVAINVYNNILDKNPYSFDGWLSLAQLYSRIKNYEKAIEAYDFALAIDENKTSIYAGKGYCLYDSGRYSEALEQFRLFLDGGADCLLAYELIAETYERMDENEKAIEYLLKVVETVNDNHDLFYKLAINYHYIGDIDKAISYLYKAVECDDCDIEAHIFLGELLLEKEQIEEAYKHLSRIDTNPITDTIPASALADACIQMQLYDKALHILLQLNEKDPYSPHTLYDIIFCYIQMGNYETAVQWVAQSEQIANDDSTIATLPSETQKLWFTIRNKIDELRNILQSYINNKED